jgi:hypothetical protein
MELGCHFATPLTKATSVLAPVPSAPTPTQLDGVHQAIVEILHKHQPALLPGDERREHPRVVFNERVTIQRDRQVEPIFAYARDLSKGGMAMIAQQTLAGELTITLAGAPDEALKVRGKVVRCSLIQEGFYDIGVAFMQLEDRPS